MHRRNTPPPPLGKGQEDMFRLLVDRVQDYAIFGLDPQGIVVSWNTGAQRIKGYRAEEIIGHHFSRFYPEEAIRSGWPQSELEAATREGRFEDEGWRIRKDGTRFWANVVITALVDDEGHLRGFAKVTRDLTERRRIERLEADATQISQFVAMLGHELRNPLAPIRNAVTLAQRQDNNDRTAWALSVIDRQATHLTRLVDDLLDIGRITRGQIRIERRRVPIHDVLAAAIETIRPSCDDKNHQITVRYDAQPIVRGDVVRLSQVLVNVLANACKYTPPGGRIDVVVSADDEVARIVVNDTGIGIDPALLPRLFDIFTQEERSLQRAEGGLGLGLAIARRLVEMHGGKLVAESPGPGCGSTFTISLPRMATVAGDAESGADASRLKVLVVDDNQDAAQTLEALLEHSGHQVILAHDGRTALRLAREQLPDVILLDIGLPGLSGYDVAREIRTIQALQGVVMVAVTGYGTDEDRRRAIECGFDVHLSKPVDYETLISKVPVLEPAPA